MGARTDRLTDDEIRALPLAKFKRDKPIRPIPVPKTHKDHDRVFCWCWISEWSKE